MKFVNNWIVKIVICNKIIDLPCDVIPKKTEVTYKNGVLDITIARRKRKKDNDGYHINIK